LFWTTVHIDTILFDNGIDTDDPFRGSWVIFFFENGTDIDDT